MSAFEDLNDFFIAALPDASKEGDIKTKQEQQANDSEESFAPLPDHGPMFQPNTTPMASISHSGGVMKSPMGGSGQKTSQLGMSHMYQMKQIHFGQGIEVMNAANPATHGETLCTQLAMGNNQPSMSWQLQAPQNQPNATVYTQKKDSQQKIDVPQGVKQQPITDVVGPPNHQPDSQVPREVVLHQDFHKEGNAPNAPKMKGQTNIPTEVAPPTSPPPPPPPTPAEKTFEPCDLLIFDTTPTQDSAKSGDPWGPNIAQEESTQRASVQNVSSEDDPFGLFGTGGAPAVMPASPSDDQPSSQPNNTEEKFVQEGLPADGEFVEVTMPKNARSGYILFLEAHHLANSLFCKSDPTLIEAIGSRPVVSFLAEIGAYRDNGVNLGYVLIAVNGEAVDSPSAAEDALDKAGRRSVKLSFYVPKTTVIIAEGMYMVKYDERTKMTPGSTMEWKPKYVVVGGIMAKPWHINMYRSRTEYETAVKDFFNDRPVSVKVKHFGIYPGSAIHNDCLKAVKYLNCKTEWKFFVLRIPASLPVKIASSRPDIDVRPVVEAVSRVIEGHCQKKAQDYQKEAAILGHDKVWEYPDETKK